MSTLYQRGSDPGAIKSSHGLLSTPDEMKSPLQSSSEINLYSEKAHDTKNGLGKFSKEPQPNGDLSTQNIIAKSCSSFESCSDKRYKGDGAIRSTQTEFLKGDDLHVEKKQAVAKEMKSPTQSHPKRGVGDQVPTSMKPNADDSYASFPSLFWGGNIAEKVKLSRRKASLKALNETKPLKVESSVKKKTPLNAPRKTTTKPNVETSNEKKRPMRIKLKMNPEKRARLLSVKKSSEGTKLPLVDTREKVISRMERKRKKVQSRARVSDSSCSSSSDSSSSSSDSSDSSSDDTSTSSSDSESDSDSDSSSCSSSSSSSSCSSDDSTSDDSSSSEEDDDDRRPRAKGRRKHGIQSSATKIKTGHNLKVRGKPKSRVSETLRQIEKKDIQDFTEPCHKPPCERSLTDAEIRDILGGDEGLACTASNWVRRSTRQPSRSAVTAPNVRALVGKLEMNDPDMVVLKCKKYLPSSDTPTVLVDTMLDALERNTNCQALYIQNFNNGMRDEQVLHLLRILQKPSCNIWCLNIGETYNVKRRTWAQFTMGLEKTKITHMYASEHTISSAMKEKIREIIRNNRKKHNMHIDPNNLDVIVRCTHCWWNPINAQALRPYIKQGGYEHILLDKVAQGAKDAGKTEPD